MSEATVLPTEPQPLPTFGLELYTTFGCRTGPSFVDDILDFDFRDAADVDIDIDNIDDDFSLMSGHCLEFQQKPEQTKTVGKLETENVRNILYGKNVD